MPHRCLQSFHFLHCLQARQNCRYKIRRRLFWTRQNKHKDIDTSLFALGFRLSETFWKCRRRHILLRQTMLRLITSWIPLTTGWTEVSGCSSKYLVYTEYDDSSLASESCSLEVSVLPKIETFSTFVAYDAFWGLSVGYQDLQPCLPRQITTWINQDTEEDIDLFSTNFFTFTSILPLRCPDGWSTVATFVKSSISTQVMCCPA